MNYIIVDDDEASRIILEQMAKQVDDLTILKSCSCPIDAINVINKEGVDLVFLDIEMPEMNGLEMLEALNKKPQVILTTSHKKYALEAFELNVVDYLVKPITLPRFLKAMDKVKGSSKSRPSAGKDFFFIRKGSVFNKVPIMDILWIEAMDDYVTIHTRETDHILHATMKSLEDRLPKNKFIRVHRSHIVQIDNVKLVEDTTIYINDVSIPIGVSYRENFMKQLNAL